MRGVVSAIFLGVVLSHFLYVTGNPISPNDSAWATFEFQTVEETRINRYIEAQEYWLGLSYGLAAGFGAWCFLRLLKLRREALVASAGGLTLSGLLGAGVCFLTGCCGSPMLPIYLGLLGPKFLSVTKPLTFAVTLLSIVVGYAWMVKRAPKGFE